jgi:hypothetical protein
LWQARDLILCLLLAESSPLSPCGERGWGIEVEGCSIVYFFRMRYTLTSPPAPLLLERGVSFIYIQAYYFLEILHHKLKVPKRDAYSPLSPCGERGRGIEVNGCLVEYFFWKNYTLTSPLAPLPEKRGIASRDF